MEKCPKCGVLLNVRVVFHNVPRNCEEHITYPYMEIGQSMHMECYIEHVIDTYLEQKNNEAKSSMRENFVCPECLNNYSREDCKLRCGALNSMEEK